MKLGFVLTNYNNASFTANAIESINKIVNATVRIIIVDNASQKNDLEYLKKMLREYENVTIIFNDTNLGYFPGLNIGLKHFKKYFPEYEYFVIGNNDVLFPNDFAMCIEKNINLFEQYPVISPGIYTLDGQPQNPHVISKISRAREIIYDLYYSNYFLAKVISKLSHWSHKFTDRKDELECDIGQEIYQGYGAMYLIGPLFFKHFLELWAPTFLMYEEYFISHQLAEKGFKIYYEPSIRLTHLMHATTNLLPAKIKWEISAKSHMIYRRYISPWSKK